jgi:hypothetical protein
MFDDLKAYFIENILVLYRDYTRTKKSSKFGFSNDLRTAINLSTSLFHLREHIPLANRKNRQYYINLCEDYKLIADIANASKHGVLTQNNPFISDINNVYEIVISTEYIDNDGEYYHIEKSVFAKLDDGNERDLNDIIINVMNMWITELNRIKTLVNYPLIKVPKFKIPKRTKNSGHLNLYAMQGLRFGPKFKLQKYNYQKGIIEPVDLTGAEIKMSVYKPKYTGTLTFFKDGNEICIEIEIEDDELKKLNKLTEEEKINSFLKIAKKQGKIT